MKTMMLMMTKMKKRMKKRMIKMNKALITLVIISSLMLFAFGCKASPSNPSEQPPEAGGTNLPTQPEASGAPTSTAPPEEVPEAGLTNNKETPASTSGITGSISEIDMLDSEFDDAELEKTGDFISEINW